MMERLGADFFHRDCLEVAPDLVGKLLIRQLPDGTILQERIAENIWKTFKKGDFVWFLCKR